MINYLNILFTSYLKINIFANDNFQLKNNLKNLNIKISQRNLCLILMLIM